MNTTPVPYDWLKSLPEEFLKLDEISLLGKAPPFPWEVFTNKLATNFELENLHIEPDEMRWYAQEELLNDLGPTPYILPISFSGFDGEIYWIMSQKDVALLMPLMLAKTVDPSLQNIDKDFQEGFYTFLAAETVNIIPQLEFDKTLTPHILDKKELPKEAALGLNVKISLYGHTLWGRLFISSRFRRAWKEHYAERKLATPLTTTLAKKIPVVVHLEAGKTLLSAEEWSQVNCGDLILLDQCSIEPGQERSKVWLTVNNAPLFRAKIRPGSLKILEFPLYQEVNPIMNKNDQEYDGDEDEEFLNEEEEELEFDEELDEEPEEGEEEAFDETLEEEYSEEPSNHELDESVTESTEEQAASNEVQETQVTREPITPKGIPLEVVVEVGRLKITVEKLLELQPGNILEVDVKPESGVDLVVNGRCVGKGELLRVGEMLGVRVLDLG